MTREDICLNIAGWNRIQMLCEMWWRAERRQNRLHRKRGNGGTLQPVSG